jgi:hypothetical protein
MVSGVGSVPKAQEQHHRVEPLAITTTCLFKGCEGPDIRLARILKFQDVFAFVWGDHTTIGTYGTLDFGGRAGALLTYLQPSMLGLTRLELRIRANCTDTSLPLAVSQCDLALLETVPLSLRTLRIGLEEWRFRWIPCPDQPSENHVYRKPEICLAIVEVIRRAMFDVGVKGNQVREWTEYYSGVAWERHMWWSEGTRAAWNIAG